MVKSNPYWLKLATLKARNIIASESPLKSLLGKIKITPSFSVSTAQLVDRRVSETTESESFILINPLILIFSTEVSLNEIIAHELLHYMRKDYRGTEPDTQETRHKQDVVINKAINLSYIELEIEEYQRDNIIPEFEKILGIGKTEKVAPDRYRIYTVNGDI